MGDEKYESEEVDGVIKEKPICISINLGMKEEEMGRNIEYDCSFEV